LCPPINWEAAISEKVMIKNFLTAKNQVQQSSHGGTGPVDLYEVWSKADFNSDIDFIDRVVVPPATTVGYHQHGDNEEMYILLNGEGLMTIDGNEVAVKRGDMILNAPGGKHGLVNNSNKDIDLLVIQISINK
jgi:mannose-6-phosphate isomerase-like protein (cupin superfamily)